VGEKERILCASPQALELGVCLNQPLKLCPNYKQVVVVKPDYPKYKAYQELWQSFLKSQLGIKLHNLGFDECTIELSNDSADEE
jgi:nucleotidyltransferase/DNA polymerase involved in DNA repair